METIGFRMGTIGCLKKTVGFLMTTIGSPMKTTGFLWRYKVSNGNHKCSQETIGFLKENHRALQGKP